MDADDELIINLSAIVVATVAKKRRKRRHHVRSCWVRPWLCRRFRLGGYEALLKDIRVCDEKAYQNFCRMNNADYQELLKLVSPYITHQYTRFRKAISADERLAVTLRFLATGI